MSLQVELVVGGLEKSKRETLSLPIEHTVSISLV